jgi:hypothetical protein
MDIEKLVRLGHEIQDELGFHPEKGLTKAQREEVLKLLKILDSDDDCDEKHWALLDVLATVSARDGNGSAAGILKNIPTNKQYSDVESLQSALDEEH